MPSAAPPSPPRAAALALAALLGLIPTLAACGGGDGDAAKPAPPAGGGQSNAPAPAPAPVPAPPPARPGQWFEECAETRGLRFMNRFLEPEQGANFKINLYDHGTGTIVADFDGDGDDDVYLLGQLGGNGMFRNDGGRFTDVTKESGTGLADRISVGGAAADIDGDGDRDLFVTTTRGGNCLFVNEGGWKFVDLTKESGLHLVMESMAAAFFDADGDADLDLLLTNTARWTLESYDRELKYYQGKGSLGELIRSEREFDVFYLNDGKGRFTDATESSGLKGKGWGGDIAVFDMEGDGDLDVYVCNMFGSSTLYANDGKAKFTDVTKKALGKTSWGAVGVRAFDYDGDGLIDIFVSDMHSDMWIPFNLDPAQVEEAKKYASFFQRSIEIGAQNPEANRQFELEANIRPDEVLFGNCLHRNRGDGTFEEVSGKANSETFWPWGCTEGDFDGDGWQDVYIPSGMGYPLFYWRSPLLRNRGDGTFEDVSRVAGTEPPPGGEQMSIEFKGKKAVRSSRSAATGDFDGDGRLDLVVNNFNERAYLYRNVAPAGRWCAFRLTGTKSNRDAIGALIKVTAGGRTRVRQVQASGGYLSQCSNTVHFGLGKAAAIERVEIRWPGGRVQVLDGAKIDAVNAVTEPAE